MTKRGAYGSGTIDPSGEGSWRLRYRIDGRRYTKTVQGTRTAAQKELRRLLASGDEGKHIAPDRITLAQWADQWLALLERKGKEPVRSKKEPSKSKRKRGRVSARTLERYSDLMRLHVKPILGNRPLQRITAAEIDALYINREQILAPRTVHHIHVALKACLAVAKRKKLIAANPADDAEAPTFEGGDAATVLEQDQLTTLVQGFVGRALYPMVLTGALTGARLNEILALRVTDVNFEAKTLSILRAIEPTKKHGLQIKPPKTARGLRTIAIDDELIKVLRQARDRLLRLVAGVADGAEVDLSLVRLPEGTLLFPSGPDLCRPRNHHTVGNDFRERAAKLGFKGFRFHDLRATHSTLMLDEGVPVHVVAARIGDDPATLLRIYVKRTRKADKSAAAVINGLGACPSIRKSPSLGKWNSHLCSLRC
jgi:integrase